VKCINNKHINSKITAVITAFVILALFICGCGTNAGSSENTSQETKDYTLFSKLNSQSDVLLSPYSVSNALCVADSDVSLAGFTNDSSKTASGLFDLSGSKVLEAKSIFTKVYPASTTKILTAYLALKYGNLDDTVTVSENAVNLESGSQMCGLKAGDKLSLHDLLYGLLLYSGNDAAVAVAEYISGSADAFVALMNKEAASMMAASSHFANPDGLHDDNHYTTVYDLYLIFNECIKNETFTTIIDTPSYTGTITHADGTQERITWKATNYYFQGYADPPANITVLGGKTGTTDEAGSCLILYTKDSNQKPYISIIMDASNKTNLYEMMNELLSNIPAGS